MLRLTALDELRVRPAMGTFLVALVGIWTIWLSVAMAGDKWLAGTPVVLLGAPTFVALLMLLEDEVGPLLKLCAGWMALAATALGAATIVPAYPLFSLVPFAILVSALACIRWPAATAVTAFALTGFYGTFRIYTGLSGAALVDLILGGIWIGMFLARIAGGRAKIGHIWPAFALLGLYIGITTIEVFTTHSVSAGFLSYRLSTWYLLAAIVIAYAGWSQITYARIARGAVVVGAIVGAYASLRWFIGPSIKEQVYAAGVGGAFNYVDGELRTFGSFGSGHQLGFWAGVLGPFCLAAALGWQGRWRWIAAASFVFLGFAELASEVRGGFMGFAVGTAIVLLLFQVAPSMPRVDIGRKGLVAVSCVGVLVAALLLTNGGPQQLERYTNILTPSQDDAYERRAQKWSQAIAQIDDQPFGNGLGTASLNPSLRPPHVTIATYSLDNSYLRIAYEQGFPILLLFVAALGWIVIRLGLGTIRSHSRGAAAVGMGAAGTLGSVMVLFYTGMYNEDVMVLGAWMIVGLGAGFLLREEAGIETAEEPAERRASASEPIPARRTTVRPSPDRGRPLPVS